MQRGPQAFFWLFGPSVKQNERAGNVAIVHCRGPLEHHDDSWGENYEGLLRRFQDALSGEDSRKTIIEKHRIAKMWGDDPPEEIVAVGVAMARRGVNPYRIEEPSTVADCEAHFGPESSHDAR